MLLSIQSTPVIADILGTATWCPYERESVIARSEEKKGKCICWIYGRRKYLDRVDELIQGDETAKLVYEEKYATKKAKAMACSGSRL